MNKLNVQGGHHPPDQKRQGPLNLDGSAAPMERYSDTHNDTPARDSTQVPAAANAHGVRGAEQHKIPVKWRRVLAALLTGRAYHRFQAERELSDHCLHTTVSTLESKGMKIDRQMVKVPGFMGVPTVVASYWLAEDSYDKARALLAGVVAA